MRLFTSRWQNRDLAELECQPVGISRGTPRFRTGFKYRLLRELAPDGSAWAAEDERDFTETYTAQLEQIGPEVIVGRLRRISEEAGGAALVLLCYEPDGEFCHRHLLSAWLRERGVEIRELVPGDLPQREDATQGACFERRMCGERRQDRSDPLCARLY